MTTKIDYKLTWSDYFFMDSQTYYLKKEIVDFINNYFKSDGKLSVYNHYLCRGADISILERRVENNKTLSNDNKTLPMLNELHKKINKIRHQIIYIERQGYDCSFDDVNFYSNLPDISSSHVAVSNDLTWPGGVHVPVDIHPSLPDQLPSSSNNPFDISGVSYAGYDSGMW